MTGRLIFLFTLVPLLELYILIKIGGYLGAFQTIALVVFTALLGIALARFEGLRTLQQIKRSLSQGIVPAEEMFDGLLIFVGGILLITPGVLTDLFALLLLIPYTRTIFKRWLRRRFDRMVAAGNVRLQYYARNQNDSTYPAPTGSPIGQHSTMRFRNDLNDWNCWNVWNNY
jgi:UPF0716 protein FxsA